MNLCPTLAPLKWERVSDDGLRAEESLDEWLIARKDDGTRWPCKLWRNHEMIGEYESEERAKAAAENLRGNPSSWLPRSPEFCRPYTRKT